MGATYYISHESALSCLRRLSLKGASLATGGSPKRLSTDRFDSKAVKAFSAGMGFDGNRCHLLVPEARLRLVDAPCLWHVWKKPVPRGSFIEIDAQTWVSAPEFVFLQMAQVLEFPQLLQLGYELCGTYVLDPDDPQQFHVVDQPLTSPVKLRRFLESMGGCRGVKAARRALRWIVGSSRSPMETDLTLLLGLPVQLGGCQLPLPQLNHEIVLSSDLTLRAGVKRYFVDLYWPDSRFGLEYDSKQEHSDRLKSNLDKKRLGILDLMGVSVLSVTELQVFRVREFDTLVKGVCRKLGRRYVPLSDERIQRQMGLRLALFARMGPEVMIG